MSQPNDVVSADYAARAVMAEQEKRKLAEAEVERLRKLFLAAALLADVGVAPEVMVAKLLGICREALRPGPVIVKHRSVGPSVGNLKPMCGRDSSVACGSPAYCVEHGCQL